MNITIRKATIQDAEPLTVLGVHTFTETWAPFTKPDDLKMYVETAYAFGTIRQELVDGSYIYFVAIDGEKMIGFAKIGLKQELGDWITDKCLEICRLYVLKEYFNKKAGKQLMEASIDIYSRDRRMDFQNPSKGILSTACFYFCKCFEFALPFLRLLQWMHLYSAAEKFQKLKTENQGKRSHQTQKLQGHPWYLQQWLVI